MSTSKKLLCKTYDARGNGDGEISCTITGNHQSFISDYTAIALQTFRKTSHPHSVEIAQGWEETNTNDTLNVFDSGETRTPTLILENHPNDSRVKIRDDNIFQTLSSRMGTGGGQYTDGYGEQYGNISKKTYATRMRATAGISNGKRSKVY